MAGAGSIRGALMKVALVLTSLFVSALLAEGVLRIYAHSSDSWVAHQLRADPFAVLVEAHGDLGYRQKADRTFHYENGTTATSNSMGFRGPEVAIPKAPGTVRVLLFGGSTTHGWGVDDAETIDRHMSEMLRNRHPGRTFEVINLAFDGYDAYQILERLRSDGLRLEPDFIIVNTGVNDVRNARFPDLKDRDPRTILWLSEITRSREEQRRGGPTLWTRTKHYLYLARLPATARAARSQPDSTERVIGPYPDALDYFETNLTRIIAAASKASAVVLLSTEPSSLTTRYQPDDTSPISYWIRDAATTQAYRDSLDARLHGVASRASSGGYRVARVPYLELEPGLFLDDAHLNGEGNRRMAEAFVAAIEPFLQ